YNNSNVYTDYVSFTFFGSSAIGEQDYEFFIHVYNPNNGSGGNGSGNGTWSAPTLSIDITELVDHGTATNYSIEFNIDDMDYNSSYSWDFVLLNQTMDLVFSEFVESVSGNTSVTVEAPEVNQGGGIMLDDGCYVMAGFVHDETAQIEVEPIFDYLSVGGDSCTSVFVDVVDWPQQTGDPVMADLLFVDLDLYSNYTVFYQIKNDTSLMSSGNLTTYAESGMYNEMYNISSQGLAEDCYEFHAELYDGNGNLVQNAFEHVDSTYFEVGSPNCAASPGLDVWTDDYIYNAGDGAEVTIEAWDLDQDETYHVYWSLYNGGTYENGSSFSISNADWAENEFTIWDLWTDGCYYLQVELYDDWNNSLDYLGYEFEVGSGNCNTQQNYPSIDVWSQNDGYDWDTGDTVIIGYELMDLNIEHYYSVEWEVHDRENWNMVASGEWSESQAEEHYGNFSIGNLADGCYEIEAQLYDEGSELDIWDWMDDSFTEITVGADTDCNPMSIYAQGGDFESGEDVSFDIYMDNLDNNTNHTIRLELHKQRVGLDSTSEWDFISDGEHMWTEWDLGQLEDGCYGIELYLLSDDGDFARGGHGFRVGDVECVQPWVEMNSDRTTFEVEVNYFDMTFYDFP
ncbi:MAG: hypothetical protein QF707_08480, partial [Candidatus Poseidoniaceae archaeon]|nr:hypothetical protein [Candidatus Poseidoniaceae archaeon]